jgi:predicted RNA binding protein YcfA (HicA-like mRNA interferase family)
VQAMSLPSLNACDISYKIYNEHYNSHQEKYLDAKEILKRLKAEGWEVLRQRGSHIQMGKGDKRTTVPNHGKEDVKIGTLKSIEKETGIKLK